MVSATSLDAIERIRRLKARYFRCMDTKDWKGFRAVFAADATLDVRGENHDTEIGEAGLVYGADAICAFVRGHLDTMITVHHGHMPEIEIEGDRATGVWAMEDLLLWPDGHPLRRVHGYGHYHEVYRREQGDWRIAATRLSRLHVDIERN